jgi:hypothetical protein
MALPLPEPATPSLVSCSPLSTPRRRPTRGTSDVPQRCCGPWWCRPHRDQAHQLGSQLALLAATRQGLHTPVPVLPENGQLSTFILMFTTTSRRRTPLSRFSIMWVLTRTTAMPLSSFVLSPHGLNCTGVRMLPPPGPVTASCTTSVASAYPVLLEIMRFSVE